MTKEKRFKKEYGIELLRIAEGDLQSAKVLEKDNTVIFYFHYN